MKRCPICSRTYADNTLNFCLQDGAALQTAADPNQLSTDPDATIVGASRAAPERQAPPEAFSSHTAPTEQYTSATPTTPSKQQPDSRPAGAPARVRSTGAIVALSVLATLVAIMLGGVGAWLVLRSENRSARNAGTGAGIVNSDNANASVRNDNSRSSQTGQKPTPVPSPSPVATANIASVRDEITTVLNSWAQSASSRDANSHASFYAQNVDPYYKRSNVSSDFVRADTARAYSMFSDVDIRLSNIQVTPQAGSDRATAIFDKTWDFRGERNSSGSVQQEVWLQKVGNRWLITGEKDLKVYYLDR